MKRNMILKIKEVSERSIVMKVKKGEHVKKSPR